MLLLSCVSLGTSDSQMLQLTAIWAPKSLTFSCVNKSGTAHGLTQRPIKGDTPFFTAISILDAEACSAEAARRPEDLSTTVLETDVCMAAKAAATEQKAPPDMSKCSLSQLNAHVVKILLGHGLMQMTLPRLFGLHPPHSAVNVDSSDKPG